MKLRKFVPIILAGFCAGAINGLIGAGGGMVLVPLLVILTDLDDREIFPASVSIILPICIISLLFTHNWQAFSEPAAWLLLLGSAIGGIVAGIWGKHIPTLWLHRILGLLIIVGGLRYLC